MLTTSQEQTLRLPSSFPKELEAMIAAEADEEDVRTQRLVHPFWVNATLRRFQSSFGQVAFEYTKTGVEKLLRACQDPIYGPLIHTLILIVDCKRRNASGYQQLYNQALVALAASGQPVKIGVRWRPTPGGEIVTPDMASGRLGILLDKKILTAARAAGLAVDDLLIELPDPLSLPDEPNIYTKLTQWIEKLWWRYGQVGASCKVTLRFDNSIAKMSRPPSLEFTRRPDRVECHGMLSHHYDALFELFQGSNRELAMYNCSIAETFFQDSHHNLRTIILEGVTVYKEPADEFRDIVTRELHQGSCEILFERLLFIHSNLDRLRLKNLYEGGVTWLSDGPHTFDLSGAHKLSEGIKRLIEGYRGWEIPYWTCGDDEVRARLLVKYQGTDMGSGLL